MRGNLNLLFSADTQFCIDWWAKLGDAFGGLIGTLFTALVIFLMWMQLRKQGEQIGMQRVDLKLQREELEQTREELKGQKEATEALRDLQHQTFAYQRIDVMLKLIHEASRVDSNAPQDPVGFKIMHQRPASWKSDDQWINLRYRIRELFQFLDEIDREDLQKNAFHYVVSALPTDEFLKGVKHLSSHGVEFVRIYERMAAKFGDHDSSRSEDS